MALVRSCQHVVGHAALAHLIKILFLGPMAYKRKTYIFPNAIEVEEYHTGRYGAPGQKRGKKEKPSPEQLEKANQRNKEKRCRRKLRQHFKENDYFVVLTYARENRPQKMAEAKKHFAQFMRIVRKEYDKRGQPCKWIRNIEVGTKNAWHVHLVVNRIADTDLILNEAWKHGRCVCQLMYEKGEFEALAAYITKTEKTDSRLRESNYSCSRNLPLPEPKEKVYHRWKTWTGQPKPPKGFYMDKDSVHEGINPVTGFKYREYAFLRTKKKGKGDKQ